jgi:ribose transport system substrate-binding protein
VDAGIPVVTWGPTRRDRSVRPSTACALDLLREGKVQVLLGQKYFGWGSESVRLLHDIINGRPPAEPVIDSGVDIVTRENVEQYAEQWRRMEAGR